MVFQTIAMTYFAILTFLNIEQGTRNIEWRSCAISLFDIPCSRFDIPLCPPCQRTKTAKGCLLDKRKMKFLKRKIRKMEKTDLFFASFAALPATLETFFRQSSGRIWFCATIIGNSIKIERMCFIQAQLAHLCHVPTCRLERRLAATYWLMNEWH
jgi:hypothetical protein